MSPKQMAILGLIVIVSGGAGFLSAQILWFEKETDAAIESSSDRAIAYWVAPMDPNFRRDGPGKSPMGMDLIPVYEEQNGKADDDETSLWIDAAVVNNIGVRTTEVVPGTLPRQISTVGFISPNENSIGDFYIRAPGWVEELAVKTVGEKVASGDLLFRFHSPELVSAQAEFLQAQNRGNAILIDAARERLFSLGISAEQIDTIVKTGKIQRLVDVRAHRSGTVLELGVREGAHVALDDQIISIADLSSVWVLVDLFENEALWVEAGQKATVRLGFEPARTWQGTIDYVYPTVDADSRSVRARIILDNSDGALRPNMYANVKIEASPGRESLVIPQSALIRTSKGDRVVLALENGRFRPAEVVAGIEAGNRVEILQGLSAGEVVVTAAQFLIDSEASLDASLLRLAPITNGGEDQ